MFSILCCSRLGDRMAPVDGRSRGSPAAGGGGPGRAEAPAGRAASPRQGIPGLFHYYR